MLLLQERIDECKGALSLANVAFGAKRAEPKDVDTYGFKKDPKDFNVYWDVRKGLIPIVGGARETGVSLLLPFHAALSILNRLGSTFYAQLHLPIPFCWCTYTANVASKLSIRTHSSAQDRMASYGCNICLA